MPLSRLFDINYLKNRLSYVYGISTDVRLRFLISGSTAHYGKLIVSVRHGAADSDFQDEESYSNSLRNILDSSRQHLLIDVGNHEQDNAIIVPIIMNKTSFNPYQTKDRDKMPMINIRTLTPIHHALDMLDEINVTVYGSFVDFKYTCSYNQPNAQDLGEPISSGLLHVSDLAMVGANLFSGVPELALPLEVVSAGASLVGGTVRHFGLSRPMEMDTKNYYTNTQPPLANTDLDINGRSLALTHSHSVAITGAGRSVDDPLNIPDLLMRDTIVDVIEWDNTKNAFDPENSEISKLFNFDVNPYIAKWDGSRFVLTPSGLVASQFSKWRGSMIYSYEIVSSQMFGGKLIFFHDPWSLGEPNTHLNQSMIVDIKDTNMVSHECHWMQNEHAKLISNLPLQFGELRNNVDELLRNGVISCYVHSPLRTITGGSAKAYIIIRAHAHKDMLFWDHVDKLYYTLIDKDNSLTTRRLQPLFPPGEEPFGAPSVPVAITTTQTGVPTVVPVQSTNVPSAYTSMPSKFKTPTSLPTVPRPSAVPTAIKTPTIMPTIKTPIAETALPTKEICPIVEYGIDTIPIMTFQTVNPQRAFYGDYFAYNNPTRVPYLFTQGTYNIKVVSFNNGSNPTVSLVDITNPNISYSVVNTTIGYSEVLFSNINITLNGFYRAIYHLPVGLKIMDIDATKLASLSPDWNVVTMDVAQHYVNGELKYPTDVAKSSDPNAVISLPTAPQTCLNTNERVIMFYFRGSIRFRIDGVLQNWDIDSPNSWSSQVVVLSGTQIVEVTASHPGDSGIYIAKTIVQDSYSIDDLIPNSNLNYNQPNKTTTWITGSPGREDDIMRICAGERIGSLRSLLKYFKWVGTVDLEPGIVNTFDLYDTNTSVNTLFHVLTRSFLGLRGSMMFMYENDNSDGTRIVMPRGNRNMVNGFESFNNNKQQSLMVKHPYYTINEFEYKRKKPAADIFPIQERHIMSNKISTVTMYQAICDDLSFIQYMAVPVLTTDGAISDPDDSLDNVPTMAPNGASPTTPAPVIGNPEGPKSIVPDPIWQDQTQAPSLGPVPDKKTPAPAEKQTPDRRRVRR
jgi:hypothetical protein